MNRFFLASNPPPETAAGLSPGEQLMAVAMFLAIIIVSLLAGLLIGQSAPPTNGNTAQRPQSARSRQQRPQNGGNTTSRTLLRTLLAARRRNQNRKRHSRKPGLVTQFTHIYKTPRGHKYRFRYKEIRTNHWRIYILKHPSYGPGNHSGITTHRLWDGQVRKHYICWTGQIKCLEDAMYVSRRWAHGTDNYLRNGRFT